VNEQQTDQQQGAAPAALDFSKFVPFDSGQPVESPASNLRQSIAYGVQQNPDEHAKLLEQQRLTGMTPEAAKPFANETQQAIDVESLNPEQMVASHPRTAAWATNPDNAAVSGAEDLHRLTRIEQHAATIRAYTPDWWQRNYTDRVNNAAQSAYEFLGGSGSLKQHVFEYPLARVGIGALRGTEEMLGNAASFAGLHGGKSGLNFLQRSADTLDPQHFIKFGDEKTGLDKLADNVGPMIPALMATGGTGLIARTLGLSDKAAKVLAGLSVGGLFTADQGGKTFNAMKEQGASDYDARLAANRVAALTAPANALFGATEVVPFMRDNPLLASIGLGGATGASGQLAQNVVTGRPKTEGLASAAIEGAAVQGGMHLGMGFMESMGEAVNEVEASKLRLRSQEKFEQAVGKIFEGDESLRIPAQEFVNYFVDKDIDPAAAAQSVGVKNLAEAAAAGSDLEIPKENYFAKLDPEHQRGLLQDVIDPSTNMTARQAAEGRQELEDWISGGGAEKLQADFAAADQETQATPEWQKVYGDLKQRYVDAGESDTAADSYATLQANAISNLANRAGLKPDELLALHNPQVVAGEAVGQTLFQSAPKDEEGNPVEPKEEPRAQPSEPRGWFRVLPDGRYEIGKTKIGDLSTFVHEPAHAYLELFRELTQRIGASDELKSDFGKIAEWLGTTPEEAYKNGFTREQHEKWAEANETYVQEGTAPTSGLQRAFHNFSVWLTSIYGRIKRGGLAELSSEIRGVMDRLYSGDQAIDHVAQEADRKQLFETPEEAGWTEQEFRNYSNAHGVEETEARKMILREMKDAADRERTDTYRTEQSNVRDAVTHEVDQRPEYRAIRVLRKGKLEDGTDLSLNRDMLVKQFGEDRVKALHDVHRGLYRTEGGVDADTAAELLGFGSGAEMLQSIEKAPRRSIAIEQATRDYMIRRYGDVRYDGTLNDRARFALENKERGGNIYRELRALKARVAVLEKKAADAKAAMASITMQPLERYQEAAEQMIQQKTPADLQPHRYLDASRKFSREAFDALRKGDVKKAAEAKSKELLNHFLFREATTAREYLDKFERYVARVQSKGIQQRLGLADENVRQSGGVGDFRDQFNWLMARYRLGGNPVPQAPERPLRGWADEIYGQGNEPAIAPGIIDGHSSRFVDYRNAPISEIHELHDALTNIRHLAQQQFKMYVQGKQVKFADAKQAMIDSARANLKSKPEQIFEENISKAGKFLRKLQWVDSRLIRMERLVEWLDGGKQGPWHDNLWNLSADAQGDEYKLQEDVTKKVMDALEDMPIEMRRRLWSEKVQVEGISEPLTRRRMLSIAFNMGNEGNLDRLKKTFTSFGWDPEAISRIGGMLTHEEWMFVQKAWDSLKPMGVRMQELERRLTGLPPQMVKVTPFKVVRPEGNEEINLDGGYFPIAMDPRFSQRAIEQDAKETAQNAMQSGYVRATTAKGYTKERTGFGGPLLLDYEQVLTSHVAKVAKDLSHREFMLASQRFLLDTDVRKTLRETLGPAYEQQFMPWLRTIINDNNGSTQERADGFKEGMQKLRGNIVAASLGFNASTSLLQISHAPRMALYAKTSSLAQAFVDVLARPRESAEEIRDLSPSEMRFRSDNLDRDIRAVLQEPTYKSGFSRKSAVAARFALEVMDHLLSHTLWKAAYRDALDKYSDLPIEEAQPKAVHEADSAVRLGLGTSAPKDLPAIMRSNEFNKFITTLYGFHNGVYNQLRDIGHQFGQDRKIGKATVASILTVLVPAVIGNWLTGRGNEDGESLGWWAAKKSLIFMADTVPILRSIASSLEGGHDVQFSPIESTMQKVAKAGKEVVAPKDDRDWMGIALDAGDAAGAVLGVPGSHQAVKTLRYIKRANEGKLENPNVWNAVVGGGH
jgi:hypothetical protein